MAAMAANISKLLESQTITNENIKATQAQSSSQLDVISKQLVAQYEQTATLISTIAQNHGRTHQQPPNNAPPMPYGLKIWPPKLNLPAFDGSNPLDWLFQADQYFSFYNITPPQRLSMIAFHLTGDALSWYKYVFNNRLLTTWEAFTRALETRFGPSTYDNHHAALFKLQQTSTVTAYQTEFERLSNCVVGLPPEALLNSIGLAKLIEDKTNDQISPPQNSSLTATPAPTSEALAIKRLSPAEMQQRRVDGLCFNCPEKYSPGHKCNPPKFLLLQTGHDPPLDLRVQSSNNVSLEDKAHLHGGSIDTWATSTSGKSSFL
ncbi:transposon ty3-G gag-pol polyprotein [Tanacetum coccineum]